MYPTLHGVVLQKAISVSLPPARPNGRRAVRAPNLTAAPVSRFKTLRHSDPVWVKNLLAGNFEARREGGFKWSSQQL
jgi:hypothetical protein